MPPGGFRTFLDRGANFSDCNYNYANTRTAPGHATLFTGAYSNGHGIIDNEWWDPLKKRMVVSVEDESTQIVGLAASAFFWVKMISELRWIQAGEVQPNSYYDYSVNFLFSPASLENRNTWYANLLALAMIGFFLPALALIKRARGSKNETRHLKALAILFAFSFLMATALSRPLWAAIPQLQLT